jgi:hypothetical protein
MTTLSQIKASRATRANTNGRVYVNVLPALGDSVVAYSTVKIPTRFAWVYGVMTSLAINVVLVTTLLNSGWLA